jgi:hypothetical protein
LQILLRIGHTTLHSSFTPNDAESIHEIFQSVLVHPLLQSLFATSLSEKLARLDELVKKVLTITTEGKDDLLTKEFQNWSKLLQTLPFQTNLMNVKYPDDNTILDVIAYVQSLVKTAKEIVSASADKHSQDQVDETIEELFELITEVWGVSHQPILMRDLQMLLMECLTIFTNNSLIAEAGTFQQLVQILLIIKSTQLLIDPMSTGLQSIAYQQFHQIMLGDDAAMDTSEHSTNSSKIVKAISNDALATEILKKRQKRDESSDNSVGSQSNASSAISSPFVDPQDAFDSQPHQPLSPTNAFTSDDTMYSTMAELVSIQQQICTLIHTPIFSTAHTSAENLLKYWLTGMIPYMEYVLRVLQGLQFISANQCNIINEFIYNPMNVSELFSYFQLLWNTITTFASSATNTLSLVGLYRHNIIRELLAVWGKQLTDYFPMEDKEDGEVNQVYSASTDPKEVRWIPSIVKSETQLTNVSETDDRVTSGSLASSIILDQALEQLSTGGNTNAPPITNLLDVPITEDDDIIDAEEDDDEVTGVQTPNFDEDEEPFQGGLLDDDAEFDPNERQFEDLMRQLQLLANAGVGGGATGTGGTQNDDDDDDDEEEQDPGRAREQGGTQAGGIGGIGMNIGAGLANLFGQNAIAEILGLMNMATGNRAGNTPNNNNTAAGTGTGTAGRPVPGVGGRPTDRGARGNTTGNAPVRANVPIPPPASVSTGSTQNQWKLIGIDPSNPCIDELTLDEYQNLHPMKHHFRAPLQGSITGSATIYALHGHALATVYPDYSHLNITLTNLFPSFFPSMIPRSIPSNPTQQATLPSTTPYSQQGNITNGILIELPKLYTDLYHLVR